MKYRVVVFVAALLAAISVATVAPAFERVALTPTAAAKACSVGWKHGIIGGEHKCLRRGQFCASRNDRDYHRYGFHCHTGRLT